MVTASCILNERLTVCIAEFTRFRSWLTVENEFDQLLAQSVSVIDQSGARGRQTFAM